MLHPMTSLSVAGVSGNFFMRSVASHASLEFCVAIHDMVERIRISHPGIRTSCQPLDTYVNPYSAILNFVVAYAAEIGFGAAHYSVC
jgi:hypothetical protein